MVPRVHPVRAGGGLDALPHAEPAPPHQQGAAQLHRVALARLRALQVGIMSLTMHAFNLEYWSRLVGKCKCQTYS